MATKTFTINKDHSVSSGAFDGGNAVDIHMPVGLWSGWVYRALLQFNLDWTGVSSITSAVLKLRSTTQYHVGFGASRDLIVYRNTESWSNSGGSSEVWSATANPKGSTAPSYTTSGSSTEAMTGSESTWDSIDITTIVRAWAPTSVSGGGGASNYGITIKAVNEGSDSDTWEFSTKESSYDPYITLTYTSNVAPNAPTLTNPANGSLVSTTTGHTHAFDCSDNDSGDGTSKYDIQVSTDSTFATVTHWNLADATSGIYGLARMNVSHAYAGTTLTRGTTYYWRARTYDDAGLVGPWSAVWSFKVMAAPTQTVTSPVASAVMETTYTAGTNTTPKPVARWTFSCADGHSQASAVATLKDSGGSTLQTVNITGSAGVANFTYAVANGTQYRVAVQVTCSGGVSSTVSSDITARTRWGRGSYYYDMTSAPTSWGSPAVASTVSGNQSAVIEYSSTASASEPGAWYATLAECPKQQYVWHRATLMAWGSGATSPSIQSVKVAWTNNVLTPDYWTLPGQASIDTSSYVYGTQSLRFDVPGAGPYIASQTVNLQPYTDYTLSYRLRQSGDAGGLVRVVSSDLSVTYGTGTVRTATQDWTLEKCSFNSGAATEAVVQVRTGGTASTIAWFDALKLEASAVATSWTPGYLGEATVLDAGGVQVDASKGGIFRLRGATGGTRDVVQLGNNGLKFGGDANLWSPSADALVTDSGLYVGGAGAGTSVDGVQIGGATNPGSIEMRSANPFIDFKTTNEDYGARIIYDLNVSDGIEFAGAAGGYYFKDGPFSTATNLVRGGGSSFPGSPSTNDRYFRTDLGMEFMYDGTRWLSTQLFTAQTNVEASSGTFYITISATTGTVNRLAIPPVPGTDIYIDKLMFTAFVNSGGSALSTSHYWTAEFFRVSASNTPTSLGTAVINSGSSAYWRQWVLSLGATLGGSYATYLSIRVDMTKTGTPGDLIVTGGTTMTYRVVTT